MTDTYLEPHQVSLLEASATNLRDKLLIRLLFRLGCRVSEALGISVYDVDLAVDTVTIHHLNFPRPYGRGFNLSQTSFALHLFYLVLQYTRVSLLR